MKSLSVQFLFGAVLMPVLRAAPITCPAPTSIQPVFCGWVLSSGTYSTFTLPNSLFMSPNGINDSGAIVGSAQDAVTHAGEGFLYNQGSFTLINYPGAVNTSLTGINDAGEIVGYYNDSAGHYVSFTYQNGVFTPLDVPGSLATEAKGINNKGDIVGDYYASVGISSGFLYSGGSFTTIRYTGGIETHLSGINDNGELVGQSGYGFTYVGGVFTKIMAGPGVNGNNNPLGIDNSGDIVGNYINSSGTSQAFLDINGSFTTLGLTGAPGSTAADINNNGQIAGYSVYPGLYIPPAVPEPTSGALTALGAAVFAGAAAVGRQARKRRSSRTAGLLTP